MITNPFILVVFIVLEKKPQVSSPKSVIIILLTRLIKIATQVPRTNIWDNTNVHSYR